MKRIIAAIMAIFIMLSVCGCAFKLEAERESVNHHYDSANASTKLTVMRVDNYTELENAVYKMLSQGVESGVVRFIGYDGDPELDTAAVCADIMDNTAIGQYAVYYMSGSINKIVAYYEAKIQISYKVDPAEIKEMVFISEQRDLENAVSLALSRFETKAELFVLPGTEGLSDISVTGEKVFYSDPIKGLYLPDIGITERFIGIEGGDAAKNGEIIKLSFNYPDTTDKLEEMKDILRNKVVQISLDIGGMSPEEKCREIAKHTASDVRYIGITESAFSGSKQVNEFTAYGALSEKNATSEGIALAFKAVCNRENIECIVVSGKFDDTEHFWNIVKIDDEYYHIDPSYCETRGYDEYFMKNDDSMPAGYSWDREPYPVCSGSADFSSLLEDNS